MTSCLFDTDSLVRNFINIVTVLCGCIVAELPECLRKGSQNMPRNSPFPIALSENERRNLERTARSYTSPYIDVLRARIVLHAADGLSNKAIGERLDTPRQIVSKWRKRFFERRMDGLADEPRPGRPRAFPP